MSDRFSLGKSTPAIRAMFPPTSASTSSAAEAGCASAARVERSPPSHPPALRRQDAAFSLLAWRARTLASLPAAPLPLPLFVPWIDTQYSNHPTASHDFTLGTNRLDR